jgi:hypothetical protein
MERMMNLRTTGFTFVLALAVLAGCSSEKPAPTPETKSSTTANKPAAENQLQSGRAALQKMYAAARNWSIDSQPVSLSSNPNKGDANGEAAVWSASFASPSKRSIRNFMWSGQSGEGSGVSLGSIEDYVPSNASTRPFDSNFLKIDSTQAFEVAQKHGGAALLKKTPDMLMRYSLRSDPRTQSLSWSIQYAPAGASSKLNVIVNASTEAFVRIEK